MRRVALLVGLICVAPGCGEGDKNVQCSENSNCNLKPGGMCTTYEPTGNKWCTYSDDTGECASGRRWSSLDVGDGLSGTCYEDSGPDAGTDASLVDAQPDSGQPDAGADAGPGGTIVENGQLADLVLGQSLFSASNANSGGQSARSLYFPDGVASDGVRLWVADSANARVLQWNQSPEQSFELSDVVLGQDAFNTSDGDAAQNRRVSCTFSG